MTTEKSLIDSALRRWKSNVERAEKLFLSLDAGQLEQEVAPGKNRLIYVWGHLAAGNDALLPLLGIGKTLHPEFDGMFIANPDKSVALTVSGQSLKPHGKKSTRSCGRVSGSFRLPIGRSHIPRCRNRISSGNRIGIDSRCCSEERCTLPITSVRRPWRGQRPS